MHLGMRKENGLIGSRGQNVQVMQCPHTIHQQKERGKDREEGEEGYEAQVSWDVVSFADEIAFDGCECLENP